MSGMEERDRFSEMSFDDLSETLGLTIKGDNENKIITFLCCLTAYTGSAQFNISFNAPSSTGKSYIPLEIASLFPKEDVVTLGHCTPTAFFYDLTRFDEPTKTGFVDLERKIVVFLDQPHQQLLARLRPLLSHDQKEISLKVTDKSDRGGLRTKNIVVVGYSSVIFCTAGLNIDEQEATRFMLLSPDMGQEKIRAAIQTKIRRDADKARFQQALDVDPARKDLKERIKAIKKSAVEDINIPNYAEIERRFLSTKLFLKSRHMRDIGKVHSLIKASALLNLWSRNRNGSIIEANEGDIERGFALWHEIHICQELNLPPYLYLFHQEIIKPLCADGRTTTIRGIQEQYFRVYKSALPDWKVRQEILPMLAAAALIVYEQDPDDRRRTMISLPSSM